MNNIKRYIYVGDIHGSYKFNNFIDTFNNGSTFFYFLGDLFNRGLYSYQNFQKIKKLHSLGLADVVIGNHDIFFLMSKGLTYNTIIKKKILKKTTMDKYNYIKKYYDNLYFFNGGNETDDSFKRNISNTLGLQDYNNILESRYIEVVDYIFSNFNIYIVDKNNNLLIHGGIPILPTGELVTINIDNELYSGYELVKKINDKFKLLEIDGFELLESGIKGYDKAENILSLMLRLGLLKNPDTIYNSGKSMFLSPIWYNNSLYDKNEIVRNTLLKELDEKGLNYIFLGHWWNKESENNTDIKSKYWLYNRVFRMDKSYNYGDLGYSIFDKNNNLLSIGQF